MLVIDDMNAYSLIWNLYYQIKKNAKLLKDLIEKFDLFINNKPGQTTRPASKKISIIDLVLSIIKLGFLTLWKISKKYPSFFNHELIFF